MKQQIIHFAVTEKKVERRDPMCGYAAEEDIVTTDTTVVSCQECLDWITPAQSASTQKPQL